MIGKVKFSSGEVGRHLKWNAPERAIFWRPDVRLAAVVSYLSAADNRQAAGDFLGDAQALGTVFKRPEERQNRGELCLRQWVWREGVRGGNVV